MPDQRKIRWIARGKTYSDLEAGRPDVTANIEIPESENGIKMKYGGTIYGEPIDARLAIFYIRKLWTEIKRDRILSIHKDTRRLMDDLDKEFKDNGITDDKMLRSFTRIKRLVDDQSAKAENWIAELLDNSFAITMEKSVILKTLSQPECEGIRFYLCMKDPIAVEGEQQPVEKKENDVKGVLTLVTVGVNKEGHDLHFQYYPEKHEIEKFRVIPDVETSSLCTEYPKTSGRIFPKRLDSPELVPYVLYKYAIVKENREPDQ